MQPRSATAAPNACSQEPYIVMHCTEPWYSAMQPSSPTAAPAATSWLPRASGLTAPSPCSRPSTAAAPRPPRCWRFPSRATTRLPASSPSRCDPVPPCSAAEPSLLYVGRHSALLPYAAVRKANGSSSDKASALLVLFELRCSRRARTLDFNELHGAAFDTAVHTTWLNGLLDCFLRLACTSFAMLIVRQKPGAHSVSVRVHDNVSCLSFFCIQEAHRSCLTSPNLPYLSALHVMDHTCPVAF